MACSVPQIRLRKVRENGARTALEKSCIGYDWMTCGPLGHHLSGTAHGDVTLGRRIRDALRVTLPMGTPPTSCSVWRSSWKSACKRSTAVVPVDKELRLEIMLAAKVRLVSGAGETFGDTFDLISGRKARR
jgi:hypothetical protein